MNTTLSRTEIEHRMNQVPHWYHQIELAPGLITPGINNTPVYFSHFNFPKDCRGMRVLDIGTRDGFFAFEFERRGAEVCAVDYFPAEKTGFKVASEILNSKVRFVQDNIFSLSPEKHGTFDIVLVLGLIYHLPDPMLAINICRKLCTRLLYLETQVIDRAFLQKDGTFVELKKINPVLDELPIMQFYPADTLNRDFTNYWAPNQKCMQAMLEENLFKVNRTVPFGNRAIFECEVKYDKKIDEFNSMSRGLAS